MGALLPDVLLGANIVFEVEGCFPLLDPGKKGVVPAGFSGRLLFLLNVYVGS